MVRNQHGTYVRERLERGVERLESPDGRISVTMRGRKILTAGGSGSALRRQSAPPPRFEDTGLSCRCCYNMLHDMGDVLAMVARRERLRRMRVAYRQRRRRQA